MAARTNQYFIPGDGISREVIQADICRYLGNDALVRPGSYQGREGYFLTAYRNLTSPMIADLKADSQRWENEQREKEARGFPPAQYRASTTHQSRQYYGPSDPQVQPSGGPPVYVDPAGSYNQYPPSAQQQQQYPGTGGYPQGTANYGYASGANFAPGSEPRTYPHQQPTERSSTGYDSSSTMGQQSESYSSYNSGQPVTGPGRATGAGQPQFQPRDPYGRGGYNFPAQ
ncbi:MAG: hypothetical protein M1840_001574 [Geoglossum simile]|nr:MAG: hypothetical protein M1840_001574 [Geoglossum simile]